MAATAHIITGVFMGLSIAGNMALQLNYTGGPMGYFGSQSVGLAGGLYHVTYLRTWKASEFWSRFGSYSLAVTRKAQTSLEFFALMMVVYLVLAGLLVAIGYGLRRRLPWARIAALIVLGLSTAAATAHGIVLVASGFAHASGGLEILIVTAVVAGPMLFLLSSPRTAALFRSSNSPEGGHLRKRRWWTLSVEWLMTALTVVLAFGLVWLFAIGPLVEIVWAGILMTPPGPWL
jgi:hypothetical protein